MRFTSEDYDAAEKPLLSHGERARRYHERWLNRALALERSGAKIPKIPARAEADGGFDRLMSTTLGRAWARSWWETTLSTLEAEF